MGHRHRKQKPRHVREWLAGSALVISAIAELIRSLRGG